MSAQDRTRNNPTDFSPCGTRVGTSEPVSSLSEFSHGTPDALPVSTYPVQTLSMETVHSEKKKMDTLSTWTVHGQRVDRADGQSLDRVHGQGPETGKTHPAFILSPRPTRTTTQQETILDFFREAGHCVTQLKLISTTLHIPYGTVRHAMRRLVSLGLLAVKPYQAHGVQGIEVEYSGDADTFLKKTPSPPSYQENILPGQGTRTPSGQPLHIKKDREKDLSIWGLSMEELDTLWPAARAAGLFPGHLRKVREAFVQQGWPLEKAETIVAQTLRYLDWQLEHGGITDQHGKKVEDPVAYWFRSMQRHGYYQQPKGYVDPHLQALRQLEEEKAVLEAKKNVLALRAEQEKLAQEEEIEKTLQALAKQGKEHPLWKQIYALLPGMLRQKVDYTGSGVLTSPMVAGVVRADLRKLHGFQPNPCGTCPKADMPASPPSTAC